jgi:5-methyltetrahydropteroyltriglutamate--homocysteine methyltransferase
VEHDRPGGSAAVLTASTGLHPPDRPDLERPPGAPPATRCGTPGSIGPRRFTLAIAMASVTVRAGRVRGRLGSVDPRGGDRDTFPEGRPAHMERSEDRILTTHVGSLPRPPALRDLLVRQDRGERVDEAALARETESAVRRAVDRQLAVGIDVGNDGEQPRAGFSTYVARRMRGFGGESRRRLARDLTDHPDFAALLAARRQGAARIGDAPQAVGEVEYADLREAEAECALFLRATAAHPRQFAERFMTAVSPGTAATILLDAHYGSHERYVRALARELRKEYALVHAQGLVLQLDCPDLAMERARFFQDEPLERFQAMVALHVDAINRAIESIPRDRVRLHVCWGNYDGPHTHDVPLEAVLPLLYRANVGALSLPLAGPRHQHEYGVLARHPLPDGMLFLPGVIDTTTNVVEHPEVVAERIVRAAEVVGDPTRIVASTDCGFGTFAGSENVAESVVWAKLGALVEGARLATARLWGRR